MLLGALRVSDLSPASDFQESLHSRRPLSHFSSFLLSLRPFVTPLYISPHFSSSSSYLSCIYHPFMIHLSSISSLFLHISSHFSSISFQFLHISPTFLYFPTFLQFFTFLYTSSVFLHISFRLSSISPHFFLFLHFASPDLQCWCGCVS